MLFDDSSPRHLPHLEGEPMLAMGLSRLSPAQWIEPDTSLPRYHRHTLRQRALLQQRVYRALPTSLDAQRELAQMLLEHLTADHDDVYRLRNGVLQAATGPLQWRLDTPEPLWNASLWVADDLVLMQPAGDGYRLTAASLCSPSSWNLEEKFNRPLAAIHDPVPDIHTRLSGAIERFFRHLRPGPPLQRFNWTLQAGDALNRRPQYDPDNTAAAPLFYRVERQTLRRLPRSDAIVFTIRVYLHPLRSLAARPGAMEALARSLAQMPAHHARYKGLDRLAPALARLGITVAGAGASGLHQFL